MALNTHVPDVTGTAPTLAAPTASETISDPTDRTLLLVVVGATATTITIPVPGTDKVGRNLSNLSTGALTNTTRLIRITRDMVDPATNAVTVNFSSVAGVTAALVRL